MQKFFTWIDRLRTASEEARPEIESQIWSEYGVNKAVLALDMSHFSLFVRRSGILFYLGMIREMQSTTIPLVESFRGSVVKCEADNLMAVFDSPLDAIEAAVAMNRAFEARVTPVEDRRLEVSIGIDFGRILWIRGADCFGDSVNLAFKLGEDLARAGEILVTDRVRDALENTTTYPFEEIKLSISGVDLTAFRVAYTHPRPA